MFRMAAILVPALGNEISNTSFPLAPYADQPNNSAELQNASVRDRQNLSLESSELGGGVQARGNLRGSSANDRRSQLYTPYRNKNCWTGAGAVDIDSYEMWNAPTKPNYLACQHWCTKTWDCDCVVYHPDGGQCFRRKDCHPSNFQYGEGFTVYMKYGSTPAPVPWPVWTPAPPAPTPVRSVDPRCDTSPHSNCEGMLFGIDTNYNDCDKDWKCDKSWEHSACDCAMACYHNSRCKTWVWEADDHWCWQKPQVEHVRKFHHKRISGEEYTCHHS